MKPYSSLIAGMNKPGISAKIGITMCVINVVLNYLFIPKEGVLSTLEINGPVGAAIATLFSLIVGLIGFQFVAKKMTHMKIINSHIPRHIFAGFGMGLILYYSSKIFVPSVYWYQLFIFSLIGIALYFVLLVLLKEFTKQDFNFFWNMIHPKEMMKYIKSEMKGKI
jgi:Na+-driven multidrug efflux pump